MKNIDTLNQNQVKQLKNLISGTSNIIKRYGIALGQEEYKELIQSMSISLSLDFQIQGIYDYYKYDSLEKLKLNAYLSSLVSIICFRYECEKQMRLAEILFALLSDNDAIIDWFSQHATSLNTISKKARDNIKQLEYHDFALVLAMAGEWEELAKRCDAILTAEPSKKMHKYLVDFRFMKALATGDEKGMINALEELTSPKVAKVRNKDFWETGHLEDFVSTPACIFMKLAYRNGYELDFENQWIPKDWMPIKPLEQYEIPEEWIFMREYNIWQPLPDEFAKYSPTPNGKLMIEGAG